MNIYLSSAPISNLMKYHLLLSCIILPPHSAIGCGQHTNEGKMAALIKTRVQGRHSKDLTIDAILSDNSCLENPRFPSTYLVPRDHRGSLRGRARPRLRSYLLRERPAAGRISEMALWKFRAASLARLRRTDICINLTC